MIDQIRTSIKEALMNVTKANSPIIWESIQTVEGYQKIESAIIKRMVYETMPPEQIIPHMESERSFV